jgi:hypothetical protein
MEEATDALVMVNAEFSTQNAAGRPRTLWGIAVCILSSALVASCGTAPTPIQVSQSTTGAYEAALATDEDGFAVAWYDRRDGNAEIYLRLLDDTGLPAGVERRLTQSPEASYEPSIERLGDTFVVAWYEQAESGWPTAMLGAWNRDGNRTWVTTVADDARNPVIRTDGKTIVGAWIQAEDDGHEAVWVGAWDENGQRSRAPVRVGRASRNTWNINLDVRGSDAWVVFDAATSTRTSELFIGRVGSAGVSLERLTRDDGAASKYPDLAMDGEGRVALTWYDKRDGNDEVYLYVGRAADLRGEIDDRARRITTTEGESIGAYVTWSDGRVGLAWSDKTPGAHEVYFQSFNGDGMPLEFVRRLTQTGAWSLVPAIRPWRKGFALAWTEYQPASGQIHDGIGEIAFTLIE